MIEEFTFLKFEKYVNDVFEQTKIHIYWQNAKGEVATRIFNRNQWEQYSDEELKELFTNSPVYGAVARVTVGNNLLASTLITFHYDECYKRWFMSDGCDDDIARMIDKSMRCVRSISENIAHQGKPDAIAWQ